MSQTERNIAIIAGVYAAFGRGDVASILERTAPDVVWDVDNHGYGVPWLQEGRGRDYVAAFFQKIGSGLAIERFNVKAITAAGAVVIALIDIAFTVKASGKRAEDRWEAHYWELDEQGRITKMRHIVDTLAHRAAAA